MLATEDITGLLFRVDDRKLDTTTNGNLTEARATVDGDAGHKETGE